MYIWSLSFLLGFYDNKNVNLYPTRTQHFGGPKP